MNLFVRSCIVLIATAPLAWSASLSCAGGCTNPSGVDQLICCAAVAANTKAGTQLYTSSADYYNKVLFNTNNLDGFCINPPSGSLSSSWQQTFYTKYCINPGTYYSYANFLAAVNAVNPSGQSVFPGFASSGSTAVKYKELADFLSTIAQETTSATAHYTNDGLYFRYENAAILDCATTGTGALTNLCVGPGSSPTAYFTKYYPSSNLNMAYLTGSNPYLSYTSVLWLFPNNYPLTYTLNTSPEQISFPSTAVAPVNNTIIQLNDQNILFPGYWLGAGPSQLTGQTMFEFFGWYQNNLASPAAQNANFQTFVGNYLNNGIMGFQGALWYWMWRVGGSGYRTIHAMVTDTTRPVCRDIAAVTRIVNGGCNDYNPGRLTYYNYFNQSFYQTLTACQCTYSGKKLNSLTCSSNLQTYCQPSTSPGSCTAPSGCS